jgi:4-carboxymuconolactone decarboxylase
MPEPRIAPVTDPSPEVREILATTTVRPGPPANIFLTMAHHPRLLKRFNVLGGLFLARGLLPARERELVILRTAWRCESEYEFGQHTLIGGRAGLSDEEIVRTTDEAAAGWAEGDTALIRLADEIHERREVSDELWTELGRRWSVPELTELVMLAGFYGMVAGFLNSARVQLDEGVPGWPPGTGPVTRR